MYPEQMTKNIEQTHFAHLCNIVNRVVAHCG